MIKWDIFDTDCKKMNPALFSPAGFTSQVLLIDTKVLKFACEILNLIGSAYVWVFVIFDHLCLN